MSGFLPTTIYGVKYNNSVLPGANSTAGTNPGGMVLGQVLVLNNGPYGGYNKVMFVRADPDNLANLAAFAALKWTTQTDYYVDMTTNAGELVAGINDMCGTSGSGGAQGTPGQTVPAGNYFFMNIWGPCKVLMAAGVSAGAAVVPTSTDGTLDAFVDPGSTAVPQLPNITCSVASGAGGATLAYQR